MIREFFIITLLGTMLCLALQIAGILDNVAYRLEIQRQRAQKIEETIKNGCPKN